MDMEAKELNGTCHCGTVKFRVRIENGLKSARRCNCSYCSMRGAVVLSTAKEDMEIIEGEDALSLYTFHTNVAQHYFCSKCGIYTHHQRRADPDRFGINAACLGISPFDFEEVPVSDGIRHPSDEPGGGKSRLAGVLRFVRSE